MSLSEMKGEDTREGDKRERSKQPVVLYHTTMRMYQARGNIFGNLNEILLDEGRDGIIIRDVWCWQFVWR